MCECVDFKKLAGKSCLVCRRRKVKCDKTKPVCLACVKHKSTDECLYDDYKNGFRKGDSLPPKSQNPSSGTLGTCGSGIATKVNAKPSESSSQGVSSQSHRSRLLSEIDSLRKNLSSLERLIELETSSVPTTSEFREPNSDPLSEALRGFPPMSFRNYEMISMRNGRMTFDGPLSYRSFALKDPFLAMIIKSAHLSDDSEIGKGIKRRKLTPFRYERDPVLILSSQPRSTSTSAESRNPTMDKNSGNEKNQPHECTMGDLDESARRINKSMCQERKATDKPLSMKHILNETEGNEFIGNRAKDRGDKKENSLPPSEDLELWRKIRIILDNLTILRNSHLKYELSRSTLIAQDQLFGYSSISQKNPECEILVRIQALLPPEKAIWMFIDNYFKSPIHGLYPVLIENWFTESVQTLIGPNKERETPPTVSVSVRDDFADLGVLMCVLALSNMCLVESTTQSLTKDEEYLLSQKMREGLIDVAQMCMGLFKLLRKPVLPILYCGLLIRIYRRFAGSEGDSIEGEDTSSFTGLIVEVAYGLGMNTDLEKSSQFADHEVYLHQWRKIWYLVLLLATDEALTSGNCLIIDEQSYATKLPSIQIDDQGNFPSFVTNPSLEVVSVDCIRKNYDLARAHHKALRYVTNKSDLVSCEEIQKMLEELEKTTELTCGHSLVAILAKPADNLECSLAKLTSFRGFIRSKAFIVLMTTALFIHMDGAEVKEYNSHQGRVSIEYIKKLVSMYMDLEPVLILLYFGYDHTSDNLHRMFGRASEVIVMQACVEFLAKFVPVLYIIISRCLHLKFTYLNNAKDDRNTQTNAEGQKILSSLDIIVDKIIDKLSHINAVILKLSQFNFQVWKISKSSLFMYTLLKNQADNFEEYQTKAKSYHKNMDQNRSQNQDVGENNISVNLFNYFLNSNTVKKANYKDLQEIYTLLCYNSHDILGPYIEEEKLRMAQDLRIQTSKDNTKTPIEDFLKPNESFDAQFISRATQDEELAGFEQLRQQRLSHAGSETPQSGYKLTAMGLIDENTIINFDDIDQLWAESILRTTSVDNWEDNGELVTPPAIGQRKRKPDVQSHDLTQSSSIPDRSKKGLSSEAFLKNQILLQECVIKQLQQLTAKHLNIFEQIESSHNDVT